MNKTAEDILIHYGMPRRSGRYPWGSGENPFQHEDDFLSRIAELKSQGLSEKEIAAALGLSTSQLRVQKSLAKNLRRADEVETAKDLRAKGYSLNEIAEKMGYANDSSIRSLLNENSEARMNQAQKTAEFLKQQIEEKGMIDVGTGVERELGISKEKLKEALYILELEGYPVYSARVEQATNPGKYTTLTVLCPIGTEYSAVYDNDFGNINSLKDYKSYDDGETFKKAFTYPASLDSKRLMVRYGDEGGSEKDGLIEIRRGVDDLSLGESHHAQVRIMVDGTHYIKGMAVYSDNMPDGVDIIFNTNKKTGTPVLGTKENTVLKNIKNDPDNPFGSLLKESDGQSYYTDKNGKEQLSLINKTRDEGDWADWANAVPSQFLSKQSLSLAKKQLDLAISDKESELASINSLTNPTVKKKLLQSFADDCDAAAVHLKAAALPRQHYQVILPLTSVKDNEVYAPNYQNGETVALIRYPHGGTFEIPILKVNNKISEGDRVISKTSKDAIGINSKVAERLSGADFDGDTVMVIPCNSSRTMVKITSTDPLRGLEGFDPKMTYGGKKEGTYKQMRNTQKEMGVISNLITDMTLKGATSEELARAVRHSMVVIDAEKHGLDYKQSEADNGIAALKKKYQGTTDAEGNYHEGASTLISRAKSQVSVKKRQGSPIINEKTGEQTWKESGETYVNKKTGKTVYRTQQSTKMAETSDARTLISDANTPMEQLYASYANKQKALANAARKEMVSTGKIKYSASAKETYSKEVKSLNAKLDVALKNAPKERQAQVIANSTVAAKKKDNPSMTKAEVKKESQRALTAARQSVGAQCTPVEITDREWEAIQSGAISENKLTQILNNTDIDSVRERATPRSSTSSGLTTSQINMIKAMRAAGYTTSDITDRLGISTSTVSKYANA